MVLLRTNFTVSMIKMDYFEERATAISFFVGFRKTYEET